MKYPATKLDNAGLTLLKQFEGCRLDAYQDTAGVWTIGYGHTDGVVEGTSISQSEADAFLLADTEHASNAVMALVCDCHWNFNQFDAMVSLAFNHRVAGLPLFDRAAPASRGELSSSRRCFSDVGQGSPGRSVGSSAGLAEAARDRARLLSQRARHTPLIFTKPDVISARYPTLSLPDIAKRIGDLSHAQGRDASDPARPRPDD
jgi:hypothetical protein